MTTFENQCRIAVEKRIASLTIEALIQAGFLITVNDGEEDVLTDSKEAGIIYSKMFTTDEDYLIVRRPGESKFKMVRFIYGNDGIDVINDYSVSLEEALKPVFQEIDNLEAGRIRIEAYAPTSHPDIARGSDDDDDEDDEPEDRRDGEYDAQGFAL